jgi:hypothetical protein
MPSRVAARLATCGLMAGLALLLAATEAQSPDLPDTVHLASWQFAGGMDLPEVPEPSGMCFESASNTLFIVDDGAADRPAGVYQVDLHGQLLQRLAVGRDLEGICYCAADGRLYAADEADERVWVLTPEPLAVAGSFVVSRDFEGQSVLTAGGNGFEGIEYIAATPGGDGDYFLLLNQDDPHALLRVEHSAIDLAATGQVRATQFHRLPELNCGELWYDEPHGRLWIVHSWQNVYEVLDIDTLAQLSWEVCPGVAQEALCQDAQGRLWIGSDTGGIAVYELRASGAANP